MYARTARARSTPTPTPRSTPTPPTRSEVYNKSAPPLHLNLNLHPDLDPDHTCDSVVLAPHELLVATGGRLAEAVQFASRFEDGGGIVGFFLS